MRLLTTAIKTLLETDGYAIGDAQAPASKTFPYATLYPLSEVDRDGDMAKTDRTGWWEYSVISVGATREQGQFLADKLRLTLESGTPIPVAGYKVGPVRRVTTGVVERDDDIQPPVFYAGDIFAVFVAPT